jgi:PAS domain S-box-containing protein
MLPPQLFQNALESAPDAIVITDAAGSIIFASSRVEALFGYRSDEIEWQAVEQLLPERFRAKHVGHRHLFVQDPHVRPMGAGIAPFARRKDGEEFPVEICLSPIREGERLLTVVAIRDVTDRALIESELVPAHEKADRANAAKSRFLATASHDLLIADYHLGSGPTGLQVLTSLRTLLRNDFKAILMTRDTSRQLKELPLEGQLRVVSKPIQAERLLASSCSLADSGPRCGPHFGKSL